MDFGVKHCSVVAIDPGMNSCGWAFWPAERVMLMKKKGAGSLPPRRVGLIKAPRKLALAPRALWIAKQLDVLLSDLEVEVRHTDFVSEYPAYHGHVLGWAAGDLQKLVFLVGMIAGYFHEAHSFTPATPGEWKGQLPKGVVIRRLQKTFGPGATREWEKDMWDAVGIGLWKLGRF